MPLSDKPLVWDLSNLQCDVSKATVLAWLDVIYQHAFAEPYMEVERSDERARAGSAAGGSSISSIISSSSSTTVPELCNLLAFADAVGSIKDIVWACLAQCEDVQSAVVTVQLPDQQLQMALGGGLYFFKPQGSAYTLQHADVVLLHDKSEETVQVISGQVARQVEQLLFLALHLQLPALYQQALRFVHACTAPAYERFQQRPLLSAQQLDTSVFSDRVAAAAGVAGSTGSAAHSASSSTAAAACSLGRDAWVASKLQQHFCIVGGAGAQAGPRGAAVFKVVVGSGGDGDEAPLHVVDFDAELQHDFVCYKRGEVVRLQLKLPGGDGVTSMLITDAAGHNVCYDVTMCINSSR